MAGGQHLNHIPDSRLGQPVQIFEPHTFEATQHASACFHLGFMLQTQFERRAVEKIGREGPISLLDFEQVVINLAIIQVIRNKEEDSQEMAERLSQETVFLLVNLANKPLWLRGVNLSEANLGGADLYRADLGGANLNGADLAGADLTRANLTRADLRGADLKGADLREADLSGAKLTRADLADADLGGAKFNAKTKWPERFDPGARGAFKAG